MSAAQRIVLTACVRRKFADGKNPGQNQRTLNERSAIVQPSITHNPEPKTKREEGGETPKPENGETPSANAPLPVNGSSIPLVIQIYREIFNRYPAKKITAQQQKLQQAETDHDLIVNTIDEAQAEVWREACIEWNHIAAERNNNPLNVEAVIDFYAKALIAKKSGTQTNVAQNFGIEGDLR